MLQNVRWLYQTMRPERKALLTIQDDLIQWDKMPPPGAVHRMGNCHYYWRAGGDGWVCQFALVKGKHAVRATSLELYIADKGLPIPVKDHLGRELPLLSRPPAWY